VPRAARIASGRAGRRGGAIIRAGPGRRLRCAEGVAVPAAGLAGAEEALLRADDAPGPDDAEPPDGGAGRETGGAHEVERDERAGAAEPRAAVHRHAALRVAHVEEGAHLPRTPRTAVSRAVAVWGLGRGHGHRVWPRRRCCNGRNGHPVGTCGWARRSLAGDRTVSSEGDDAISNVELVMPYARGLEHAPARRALSVPTPACKRRMQATGQRGLRVGFASGQGFVCRRWEGEPVVGVRLVETKHACHAEPLQGQGVRGR
jgi:hypothetical protein